MNLQEQLGDVMVKFYKLSYEDMKENPPMYPMAIKGSS